MPRDGTKTRERILGEAQQLILDQGYAATSVDQILAGAGVTKGSFFHHFRSKADLAREVMQRFAEFDHGLLRDTVARAENLARDPLQQLLILVGLYEEMMSGQAGPPNGCLFASYSYESDLMSDEQVRRLVDGAIEETGRAFEQKLREAAEAHPPRADVDLQHLAEMFWVIFEGAFVVHRVRPGTRVMAEQLRLYRTYLELVFGVTG